MANYLNDAQREEILRLGKSLTGRTEWPTWLLLAGVYGAWPGVMLASPWLGPWLATPMMVLVVVLWMSVQHELLHGHPTRWAGFNKVLGYAPFAVWYPYTLYRDSHLMHHRDETLTVPGLDPESRYIDIERWQRLPRVGRWARWLDKTLPGRLLVGAPLALYGLCVSEGRRLCNGDRQAWSMWLTHGACTLLMLVFIERYSVFSSAQYLLLVCLPALSVAMVRSYYEHRPHAHPQQRSVINEAGWPWRWLFLHLNLHLVHHDLPGLPWYFMPRVYHARRNAWLSRSGGFLVPGYGALLRRHAFTPIDSPLHPHV